MERISYVESPTSVTRAMIWVKVETADEHTSQFLSYDEVIKIKGGKDAIARYWTAFFLIG